MLASYGHIRDLPSKPGSVAPKQGKQQWGTGARATPQSALRALHKPAQTACHAMPADFLMYWELSKAAEERVEAIATALRGKRLILATDPDREGEAISWHLVQELKVRRGRALGSVCWVLVGIGGGRTG